MIRKNLNRYPGDYGTDGILDIPSNLSNQLVAIGNGKKWPQIFPNQYAAGGGIPLEMELSLTMDRNHAFSYGGMKGPQSKIVGENRDVLMWPMSRPSLSIKAAYSRMLMVVDSWTARGYWSANGGKPPIQPDAPYNLPEAYNSTDTNLDRKIWG